MTAYPPTERQRDLLDYLVRYAAEHRGMSPTFDEMAAGVGLKSKSGVSRLLDGLQERGLVRRLHTRPRSVVLTFSAGFGSPNAASPWACAAKVRPDSAVLSGVSPWQRA